MRECYAGFDPRTVPSPRRDAFTPAPFVGVTDLTPDAGCPGTTPARRRAGDPPGTISAWACGLPDADRIPSGRCWRRCGGTALQRTAATMPSLRGCSRRASAGRLAAVTRLLVRWAATRAGLIQASRPRDHRRSLAIREHRPPFSRCDRQQRPGNSGRASSPTSSRARLASDDLTATIPVAIRFGIVTDPRGRNRRVRLPGMVALNGASGIGHWDSSVPHDLGFSYEDGDTRRPRVAAGRLRGPRAFFTTAAPSGAAAGRHGRRRLRAVLRGPQRRGVRFSPSTGSRT
jgi:hypothetical protein